MLTSWKLKREILRVGRQFAFSYESFAGYVRRVYYDLFLRPKFKVTDGALPEKQDVAVFLIYQPDGVPESVFFCLDYFREHNIVPIVVSNTPVTKPDKDRLLKKSFFLIERVNWGYDFGGYRDGILHLQRMNISIRNLFLLNDSIWFPAHCENTLLTESLVDSSDLFGVFHDRKSSRVSRHFLHSYFLRFNEAAVNSAFFERYWRFLPMFSRKEIVIQKLERTLTGSFKAAGFSIGALYDSDDIRHATMALNDDELMAVVTLNARRSGWFGEAFAPIKVLSDQGGDWIPVAREVIQSCRYTNYFLDSPPHVLIDRLKSPVLKKHPDQRFKEQRADILLHGSDRFLFPVIRDEISQLDQQE